MCRRIEENPAADRDGDSGIPGNARADQVSRLPCRRRDVNSLRNRDFRMGRRRDSLFIRVILLLHFNGIRFESKKKIGRGVP